MSLVAPAKLEKLQYKEILTPRYVCLHLVFFLPSFSWINLHFYSKVKILINKRKLLLFPSSHLCKYGGEMGTALHYLCWKKCRTVSQLYLFLWIGNSWDLFTLAVFFFFIHYVVICYVHGSKRYFRNVNNYTLINNCSLKWRFTQGCKMNSKQATLFARSIYTVRQ